MKQNATNLSEQVVFMVPDGNVFILRSIGNDLNEASDLCLGIQGHTEELWIKNKHKSRLHNLLNKLFLILN